VVPAGPEGRCARRSTALQWPRSTTWRFAMRAILLWLLGVPISVIILLKLFGVF
jgi:hypothetical protein